MSERDWESEEALLLGRARRGLAATEGDQARVLSALTALLAVPPVATAPSSSAPAAAGSATWGRYFWGVLALGVAGVACYGWGYKEGSAARPAPVVASPASVAQAQSASATSVVPRPPLPVDSAPAPLRESVVASPSAALPAASAAPASLDEEVRQLRRIERAIRDGNPRLAIVLGEDLARNIPRGQLLLERRAASTMAHCQLRTSDGATNAARFLREHPNSAYATRVREICELSAAPQRTGPTTGTDGLEKGGTE